MSFKKQNKEENNHQVTLLFNRFQFLKLHLLGFFHKDSNLNNHCSHESEQLHIKVLFLQVMLGLKMETCVLGNAE